MIYNEKKIARFKLIDDQLYKLTPVRSGEAIYQYQRRIHESEKKCFTRSSTQVCIYVADEFGRCKNIQEVFTGG